MAEEKVKHSWHKRERRRPWRFQTEFEIVYWRLRSNSEHNLRSLPATGYAYQVGGRYDRQAPSLCCNVLYMSLLPSEMLVRCRRSFLTVPESTSTLIQNRLAWKCPDCAQVLQIHEGPPHRNLSASAPIRG